MFRNSSPSKMANVLLGAQMPSAFLEDAKCSRRPCVLLGRRLAQREDGECSTRRADAGVLPARLKVADAECFSQREDVECLLALCSSVSRQEGVTRSGGAISRFGSSSSIGYFRIFRSSFPYLKG